MINLIYESNPVLWWFKRLLYALITMLGYYQCDCCLEFLRGSGHTCNVCTGFYDPEVENAIMDNYYDYIDGVEHGECLSCGNTDTLDSDGLCQGCWYACEGTCECGKPALRVEGVCWTCADLLTGVEHEDGVVEDDKGQIWVREP